MRLCVIGFLHNPLIQKVALVRVLPSEAHDASHASRPIGLEALDEPVEGRVLGFWLPTSGIAVAGWVGLLRVLSGVALGWNLSAAWSACNPVESLSHLLALTGCQRVGYVSPDISN